MVADTSLKPIFAERVAGQYNWLHIGTICYGMTSVHYQSCCHAQQS